MYYLQALLNNEEQLTAKDVLEKYRLGTSANSIRIKKTLIKNDILDDMGN